VVLHYQEGTVSPGVQIHIWHRFKNISSMKKNIKLIFIILIP
jgi:hypothetical protein